MLLLSLTWYIILILLLISTTPMKPSGPGINLAEHVHDFCGNHKTIYDRHKKRPEETERETLLAG